MEANSDDATVPIYISKLFGECNITFAFCKHCNKVAASVHPDLRYNPNACLQLNCYNKTCPMSSWNVCIPCNKRLSRSGVKNHFAKSSEHRQNVTTSIVAEVNLTEQSTLSPLWTPPSDMNGLVTPSSKKRDSETEQESNNAECNCGGIMGSSSTGPSLLTDVYKERSPDARNDWLEELFSTTPTASISEISTSFSQNEKMSMFWSAESASPHNCCGGGAQYLVARAFSESELFMGAKLPTLSESKYHFLNFSQHQSLSQKQKRRQEDLHAFHVSNGFDAGLYCGLSYKELGDFYSSKGKHSLWSNIAIPTVQNVDGIAYVSPEDILRYCYANGNPVDDTVVDFTKSKPSYRTEKLPSESTFHVSDSYAATDALMSVALAGKNTPGYPKAVVVNLVSDWRDGFGPSRTKNNRKSVLLWTFTVGATKDSSNSGDNTFILAVGSKDNPSWTKVERLFSRDMNVVSDVSKPLLVYHGKLRKMVPTVMIRIASLEDKPERAEITSTLEGGLYHRCFGKSVAIVPAKLNRQKIVEFLKDKKAGKADSDIHWGWSYNLYDGNSTNGGRLVSCHLCRRKRLVELGLPVNFNAFVAATEVYHCVDCADWNLSRSEILASPVPKDYPTLALEDCPVEFPGGRELALEKLPVINLSFSFLIQASRVAFYHCCQQGKQVWTKGRCLEYLRTCAINKATAVSIYEAAVAVRNNPNLDVDYESNVGIGPFQFPPAWQGDIPLTAYVETVMHQCFIGIQKSLMELTDRYLVENNLGMETYRRSIQPLLKELKKFQLSWLLIMPFNSGKSEKHTVGSWMGENWSAWGRIANIVHVWFCTNGMTSIRQGCLDVARTVMVYHAFICRLLTHSGTNETSVYECQLLAREFMSCVMELDLRVRYKEMSRKPKQQAESVSQQDGSSKAATPTITAPGLGVAKNGARKAAAAGNNLKDGNKDKNPPATPVGEPFWLKPNFFSLPNLIDMMIQLGPVVNFWDGGGKGEKGIQRVRPYITNGIPEFESFFLHLLKRMYKMRQLQEMEKMYLSSQAELSKKHETGGKENPEPARKKMRRNNEVDEIDDMNLADAMDEADCLSDTSSDDDYVDDSDTESDEDETSGSANTNCDYSLIEDQMMAKARTIYVYKTNKRFVDAMAAQKPVAGILIENGSGNVATLDFFCIVRTARDSLGWAKISFDDTLGENVNGMWYAPIKVGAVDAHHGCPRNHDGIQVLAKMSAVAIPLWYIVGPDDSSSFKYCVITNWWKPRQQNGRYSPPILDFSAYEAV